jgi:hypothetical protein
MKIGTCILSILAIVGLFPDLSNGQDAILELKEKIIDIQNQGKLGLNHFTICANIIGYGQYVALPENKVKAGSKLLIYYEPVNLFTNRKEGTYHIWYTQDIVLLAQDGKVLYNAPQILNFNYLSVAPVLDFYATNSLNLGDLPPGNYQYQAVLHDKLKKADVTHTLTFAIVP